MSKNTRKRWMVVCDDEKFRFTTRKAAREYASWLNRHPANTNTRQFGPYANVDGVARVIDLGD